MTLPIASNVFLDGELTNEASWYARIFTPINTIYARLLNDAQTTGVGTGFLSTPPSTQNLQVQFGQNSVTTTGSGLCTITLPTPFSNGLAWWFGTSTTSTAGVLRPATSGASASTLVFVAYSLTGTIAQLGTGASVGISWMAVGY